MVTLFTLNKYLHDFCAALFFACMVMAWLLRRQLQNGDAATLYSLYRSLQRLLWSALLLTLLCGGLRALTYRELEWNLAMGNEQITLLVIKHLVLFLLVLFAIGYWWGTGRLLRMEIHKKEIH